MELWNTIDTLIPVVTFGLFVGFVTVLFKYRDLVTRSGSKEKDYERQLAEKDKIINQQLKEHESLLQLAGEISSDAVVLFKEVSAQNEQKFKDNEQKFKDIEEKLQRHQIEIDVLKQYLLKK